MQFISSSQDILFLVLAFCALLLTVFMAWLLYYAVVSIRQIYEAIRQIKSKIDMVDEIITLIREKINFTSSYLSLIVGGVKKVVDLLGGQSEEKKRRTKR